MADTDQASAGPCSAVNINELGFVREIFAIAKAASIRAEPEIWEGGERFWIKLSGDKAALATTHCRRLRKRGWDLPVSVEMIHGGRIERQLLRDDDYYGIHRVAYWGLPEDLVAAGVAQASHVQRGERWSKSSADAHGRWWSWFAPSGRVLYHLAEPSTQTMESRAREDALRAAIDAGEDIGIVRRDMPTWTEWIGKREDLIAAGICSAQQFPAGRKRSICGPADGRVGVRSWDTSLVGRGHYRHWVQWTDEVQKARERKSAAGSPDKASAKIPTAEELAEACEGSLRVERRMQAQMMSGELFGPTSPRYDRATIEKVAAALDHASQLLQSAMPALPRSVVRREKQAAAAKSDGAFRAFLAAALEAPKSPRDKRSAGEGRNGKPARGGAQ